ncbi:MAG: hypothetical protein IKD45_05915 [Clostridia bacterium]|nr:hypothetical protein [Clostridia bacterium]
MKIVFKKSNLQFLKGTLHGGSGQDAWNLARLMQDQSGFSHQLPAEISLLARGAYSGTVWSQCELARTYFHHCPNMFLPEALRLWKKAVCVGDAGATWDIQNLPIKSRILAYRSIDDDAYHSIEMKCALLAELYLTNFGLSPWDRASNTERKERCEALVREVCPILGVDPTKLRFVPNLQFNGMTVDGLANWDYSIDIREELLFDLERMVEVIFHELGHMVCFEIMREKYLSPRLMEIYGITSERVLSWRQNAMGLELITTSEEDPDTLSYGVYTLWATFFL